MKKKINQILCIILFLFITACSSVQQIEQNEVSDNQENTNVDPNSVIFNELLEEARQNYLEAQKNQRLHFTKDAIDYYEKALSIINKLSYYPGVEENLAFSELEDAIVQDYQNYTADLDYIPENASFYAMEEWLNNNLPDLQEDDADDLEEGTVTVIQVGDFPLEINQHVEQYIEYFTGRGRHHMERWLSRSGKYFPMMAEIFAKEKVPQQLVFLSMIESGLNPRAKSWARAAGLWQFMKTTGSMYDLNVNFYVDDRLDPEKATYAAARHLRDLYVSLGDWYLAIASYNCGEGRVKKSMRAAGSSSFWKIRKYLPKETRNYVPQYLATAIIASQPEKFGFTDIKYETAIETKTYFINESYDLSVLALCAGTDLAMMQELNPSLAQDCTPPNYPGGFPLKVPAISFDAFAENVKTVPEDAKQNYFVHSVRKGETLPSISKRFGVDIVQLARINNLSKHSRLYPGVTLRIPVSKEISSDIVVNTDMLPAVDELESKTVSDAPYKLVLSETDDYQKYMKIYQDSTTNYEVVAPEGTSKVEYTVKKGDKLLTIAELFDTRIADIRNWNNLPYTTTVRVGQKLTLFVPEEKTEYYSQMDNYSEQEKSKITAMNDNDSEEPQSNWVYHRIQRNETISSIALKYGVSVKEIKNWNNLRSNRILRGKKLKIFTEGVEQSVASNSGKSTYKVKKGDTLGKIAREMGVSVTDLRRLNSINGNNIKYGQVLLLNKGGKGDNTAQVSSSKKKMISYEVKRGETLSQIAERFSVRTQDIRRWNKLPNNKITAGKSLKIYTSTISEDYYLAKEYGGGNSGQGSQTPTRYVVKSGESLSHIATKYNLKIADIMAWNNIKDQSKVQAGQTLSLNGPTSGNSVRSARKSEQLVHKVKNGEALTKIAQQYRVKVSDIKQWNNLKTNKINAGQEIVIFR